MKPTHTCSAWLPSCDILLFCLTALLPVCETRFLCLYLHSCQLVWSTSTKPSKWTMLALRFLVSPSASRSIIIIHLSFLVKRALCRKRVWVLHQMVLWNICICALSCSCHLNNDPGKEQGQYRARPFQQRFQVETINCHVPADCLHRNTFFSPWKWILVWIAFKTPQPPFSCKRDVPAYGRSQEVGVCVCVAASRKTHLQLWHAVETELLFNPFPSDSVWLLSRKLELFLLLLGWSQNYSQFELDSPRLPFQISNHN